MAGHYRQAAPPMTISPTLQARKDSSSIESIVGSLIDSHMEQILTVGAVQIIEGFSDYAVTWTGDVYRIKAAKGGASRSRIPYRLKPRIMGPTNHRCLSVRLKGDDGDYHSVPIHRLVIVAFHGPAPSIPEGYYEIIHRDGDLTNNRVSNLAWVLRHKNPNRRRVSGAVTNATAAPPLRKAA